MTEYDYSPEAYERHIAKQQSIARWVERQAQEAPHYPNPFLPSDDGGGGGGAAGGAGPEPDQPQRRHHIHIHNDIDDRRRPVSRSFSTPIDTRHSSPSPARHHHHHRSQSNAQPRAHTMQIYSSQHSSTPTLVNPTQPNSRSRSLSRAPHPRPPPSKSQNYASNPVFSASQSQLHRQSSASHRSHGSSSAHAVKYASLPGQPVIMQHGKSSYVVLPSRGGRVEVHSPHGVYATSPTRGPASAYPAFPMPSKKTPLLKRLFHGSSSHEPARRADVTVISGDSRRRRTSFF